jgi:hypothetical protein
MFETNLDRSHNYVHTSEDPDKCVIYCTYCGHVAMDLRRAFSGQDNTDAQRIAKQSCPRKKP